MELSEVDLLLSGERQPTLPDDEPAAPPNSPERDPESEADAPDTEAPADAPEGTESSVDEYGNEAPAPKMYSEEEVRERINKAIRKRLKEAETAPLPQQQQQQTYQPSASAEEDWQLQLKEFVRATLAEDAPTILQQQQARAQQQQQEMREKVLQQQFEERFVSGMDRFGDFQQVVGAQPITDAMTFALRGVADPASFIYAASKRHAQELQRISQIPDAYGQMVEIGKLEERMRKAKATTTAAPPISKHGGDAPDKAPKPKTTSIDDLLAASDARRIAERKRSR